MPKARVMIAVEPKTRDRLVAVLQQLRDQERRRGRKKSWWGWRSHLTMESALIVLLDRHEAHQARNRKHAAAKKDRRAERKARLNPGQAVELSDGTTVQAGDPGGVRNGKA